MEEAGQLMHGGSIVDAGSEYVTAVEASGANVHDVTIAAKLIRQDDRMVYADSGCLEIAQREEISSAPNL